MIIQILICCICFIALKKRDKAALIFAMLTLSHSLFLSGHKDTRHFISAALIDSIIIIWTANIFKMSKLVEDIHVLSLISIMINAAGWFSIREGIDSILYGLFYVPLSLSYMALYIYGIIILLRKERTRKSENDRVNMWTDIFRVHSYSLSSNGGKL